jgi:hypothetical protein
MGIRKNRRKNGLTGEAKRKKNRMRNARRALRKRLSAAGINVWRGIRPWNPIPMSELAQHA